jgi:threonyl-tRNA synthetase
VLHRAILGSLDRFMAYILEETKGNLPLWLAPVQVKVLPVKNDDGELEAYAKEVFDYLNNADIRVELDDRSEKLGYRMREGQLQKVPYILVLGNNERNERTVTFRLHGQQESTTIGLEEFLNKIKTEIETKGNN